MYFQMLGIYLSHVLVSFDFDYVCIWFMLDLRTQMCKEDTLLLGIVHFIVHLAKLCLSITFISNKTFQSLLDVCKLINAVPQKFSIVGNLM